MVCRLTVTMSSSNSMLSYHDSKEYRKVSNIRRTLVGNKIVDHSDVVGASPVGAAGGSLQNNSEW